MQLLADFKRRIPLGWLQLRHDRGRLLVAVAGIAFADLLMFMQLGFQNALYKSNTRLHQAMQTDLIIVSKRARNFISLSNFPRRRLYQAKDIQGVVEAEPVYATVITWKNPTTRQQTSIAVAGFNVDRPAFDFPALVKNRDALKLDDRYVFDRGTRGNYAETLAQLDQGKPVSTELDKHKITLIDTYKVGSSFAADGSLMTSDRNYFRAFPRVKPGVVNLGMVRLAPGTNPLVIQAALKQRLPDDVLVLTKQEFIDFEKAYWSANTSVGFVFNLGVVMGFIVGVIIVYQVLSTDVNDHLGEYATMKAMGYKYRYFLSVIFEEAILLASLGFIPGLVLSSGLYTLTRNATNLPMFMESDRAISVLVLTITMCSISGAIASRNLQAADPADMFS